MSRLRFTQTGPVAGDCTAPYRVDIDEECRTITELLKAILTERSDEWGYIFLMEVGKSWLDAPRIEYKGGEVLSTPQDTSWKNRKIECVTARGGWSSMDYYVRFAAKDEDEATKEQQRREDLEKNVAESIRAVAEYVIASADNYAKAVDDYIQRISITMEFNIDELPRVTFTQDAVPTTWINAVHDGRCHVWTHEGTKK